MTALEFIASIIKSAAWPTVAVIGIFAFRTPLADRLRSIQKITHKDTEVLFDHEAREVGAALVAGEALDGDDARIVDATQLSGANVGKIVQAWNKIQDALSRKLVEAGVDSPTNNPSALLELGRKYKIVTDDQYRALTGLRVMRNLAVHSPDGKLDDTRVKEFLVLAEAMATVLGITHG